ncbi:MAG: lysophospholipid acyltransferase family protein [Acidobacteriota bacterium]
MPTDSRPFPTRVNHRLEYLAARVLGGTLGLLPRRSRLALGRVLGGLVFALDAKHRAVTLDNIDRAFSGTKTAEEKRAIARGTFRHFGAMFFELASLRGLSERKVEKMVEFEGLEHYQRARKTGRGVLLVAAHFGNWEIHAIAHGYRLGPMAVVARLQDNPHYNRWLEALRKVSGNVVLYKQRALARMMRWLKDGGTVAVLVDQNVAREDGVFVDFFGRKAATTPVASWLAVKTGAALVPVFTLPLADGRYRLIYEEPIDGQVHQALGRQQTVQELTQRCASILEAYVRRNPEFWLWMHRRWKTRPAEETEEQADGAAAAALRTGEAG